MTKDKSLLLISNSLCHGRGYLDHCAGQIAQAVFESNARTALFVPYARAGCRTYEAYTKMARERLEQMGIRVIGIHERDVSAKQAVEEAEAIFIGGGNTHLLLKTLYNKGLVDVIRDRVANDGLIYIGASAGSNVAGLGIHVTNDMPIVHSPSLQGMGLVPFRINPHYLEKDPRSTHMGESREERITEYLMMTEDAGVVVALEEGAMIKVFGEHASLIPGTLTDAGGFLFERVDNKVRKTRLNVGSSLDHLLVA